MWVLLLLLVFLVYLLTNFALAESKAQENFDKLCNNITCDPPIVKDPNLIVTMVYQTDFKAGPNEISPASTMTFIGHDILILNKNNGTIYRIKNGTMLDKPLLDVPVANERERGLLGIASSKASNGTTYVFLYYTESKHDNTDICHTNTFCEPSTNPLGNRLYRYELENNKLVHPKLLLNLPAYPGPSHNGGVIKIGPDKNLYVVIGDLTGWVNASTRTMAQNYKNGTSPDGRAGILRITQDGRPVQDGILDKEFPLNLYYAYGIRNSFGIDFDPITGNLWDTENGPEYGDELNLVKPGFNSGWSAVQGIWKPTEVVDPRFDLVAGEKLLQPKDLVDFGGKGKYSLPEFIWKDAIGVTAVKFLNSDKLGKNYENDLFVGSFSLGIIFHFDLNKDRSGLKLNASLKDKIADNTQNMQELKDITFAKGLGGITDIKVGPDGYLYVLSKYTYLTIFRIAPRG
jgi:glucose/arabinose dehydrogenase